MQLCHYVGPPQLEPSVCAESAQKWQELQEMEMDRLKAHVLLTFVVLLGNAKPSVDCSTIGHIITPIAFN